jgi:amidase
LFIVLDQSATVMAKMIRHRKISSTELVNEHIARIQEVNPLINAVVEILADSAVRDARAADAKVAAGEFCGPLHGVPISIKDSIDVQGTKCTAGTLGRKNAAPAKQDATLVHRLRAAGAIPIAKTNLPDLLFAYETDNFLYGRTSNPYNLECTAGGSSGGESALIAACGSPLGLGSDAAGSVRVPAAFCGIASIKPTSGRLPRTGHVPPAGGWIEALWQIGPMARWTEDLAMAMNLLCGEDDADFTSLPVQLLQPDHPTPKRVAFFTHNGFVRCSPEIENAISRCADFLSRSGMYVDERRPPFVEEAYELELALLGADGGDGIDAYLHEVGSTRVHPLLVNGFLNRIRPFRATASELASQWARWDEYRAAMKRFFEQYDAVICPVYTQPALRHGESVKDGNFEGFSYTMVWNLAGAPAVTVRCAEANGLPINVQIVTKPWRDLLAIEICQMIEAEFGGWRPSRLLPASATLPVQKESQPVTAPEIHGQ